MAGYATMALNARRLRSSNQQHNQAHVRRHLAARMGKMRGLPQKLGQMISFSSQAENNEPDPFAELQENADPLPLATIQPVLEAAWGKNLDDVLSWIDPQAHAASLGQVHRAMTLDGQEVAVKVQYPGIRESVMTDLKMLGWLSMPVGNLGRGFDLSQYRETVLLDLQQELDYRQEARQQAGFASWANDNPFLIVPEVVTSLSTKNVLVTQWQEGDHWNEVRTSWSPEQKRQLANGMLRFFLQGLFLKGKMQADWHPGNFRFKRNGDEVQLLLYDFGSVYEPRDDDRLALAQLIRATQQQSGSPWPLFLKLGFNPEYLEPLSDKLPALCQVLFEPFCCDSPVDLADWNLGQRVSDILEADRWNFRIAGSAKLIFLLRAFHGLIFYLEGLKAPVFWKRTFESCLKELEREFEGGMQELEIHSSNQPECRFESMARHLKIRVRNKGTTKVELTLSASAIESLDDMLDEDVKQKIGNQGIELAEIVSSARKNGYAPKQLFDLIDGDKHIQVWLE